jgi:hypothetical protein
MFQINRHSGYKTWPANGPRRNFISVTLKSRSNQTQLLCHISILDVPMKIWEIAILPLVKEQHFLCFVFWPPGQIRMELGLLGHLT